MFLAPKVEGKEEGSIYKDIESKDDTEILEKKVVEAESKDNIKKGINLIKLTNNSKKKWGWGGEAIEEDAEAKRLLASTF